MKATLRILLILLVPVGPVLAAEAGGELCEPWYLPYADEDAAGDHVIALWQFDGDEPTRDASGHGHDLTVEGAKLSKQGRFGGCLETFPGWPVEDKRHRARAADHPDLSPEGAFTLEMWFQPKPELGKDYLDCFLLDKKYVSNDDYQLILGAPDRSGSRELRACLGFGKESSTYYARPAKFEPGVWYHVAFTYDGAGTGQFFLGGIPWGGGEDTGRRSISPGKHPLSIGDRIGSYYHGLPGYIDQVRICRGVRDFRRMRTEQTGQRTCFVRMEPDAALRFVVTNLQRQPVGMATASVLLDGQSLATQELRDLGPGQSRTIQCPIDSRLRPDAYPVQVKVKAEEPVPFESQERFTLRIVPRPLPDRFPVLMWGVYGNVDKEFERLKRIGFTHVLGLGADYDKIWEAGRPTEAANPETVDRTRHVLDEALAEGLTLVASLSPGSAMRKREEFRRIDRHGKPYKREDICGLFPALREYCYNVGASVAQTYGQFPAFGAAMIHTEVRGQAQPCFHGHDREAFKKHAGFDIPDEVAGPRGVDYRKLPDFPAGRVIPDDDPLYVYYRWYWKTGDGWNGLSTAVHRGLKSTGRDDLWTYHDPAVRVASVYGSGGEVDVISQWTYTYPDPIRIGLATDELLAMAAGAGHDQQVMKMTQIIWYRSQTAPQPKPGGRAVPFEARWEREQPDAPFITIAPMHLREALWCKIARPIKGIMYHGWQSLVPCEGSSGYRYTHDQTQHELARLIHDVIRPLGPTLLKVPAVKSDVAMLESFASEMFARRGTYGWNGGWAGDVYHVLLYAHLQPEIIFDETIVDRGLDGYRVLVMPDCDVITETMAKRIKAFQARGGIVVGDERLCPAIEPNICLEIKERTGNAYEDKRALTQLAEALREQLDSRYTRYVDSSNTDVIPYRRRWNKTDYVFLVNDHRWYGRYVGHHGIVMENGGPANATITVRRPAGHVYDLVTHRKVDIREGSPLSLAAYLGPCEGILLMICPQEIRDIRVTGPGEIERGGSGRINIQITDPQQHPVEAVVPVEVRIADAEGRPAEFSGYYAAVDGRLEIPLDVAPNEVPGAWHIEVRELASGKQAVHDIQVPEPTDWPPKSEPPPKDTANPVQPYG